MGLVAAVEYGEALPAWIGADTHQMAVWSMKEGQNSRWIR